MTKIDEYRAVLDIPEESQKIWLVCKNIIKNSEGDKGQVVLDESLADLAFRMRDEMFLSAKRKSAWCQGCRIVIKAVDNSDEFPVWPQPIHWIVVVLIAEELAKQEK